MTFTKDFTKDVRKWLKKNDFAVSCRLGKEFLYEPNENFIQVQKIYDDCYDSEFLRCLKNLGLTNDFDCITLSILHELGHFETLEDFTEEEWNLDSVLKQVLCFANISQSEMNEQYWETPTEKRANQWVVWYVENFTNEVEALENIVGIHFVY